MTQRTAGLNLKWDYLPNGFWHADLPTIPGYTYQTDPPVANVLPVYSRTGHPMGVWKLQMGFNTIVDGGAKLTNNSFGIPDTETAEEMMQAVDNLSVEEISQTLSDCGYYAYFPDEPEYHHDGYWDTLSGEWIEAHKDARAKHASRRIAHMDLDWKKDYDYGDWEAPLPAIPGYPGTRYDGNVYAVVGPSVVNGEADGFRLYISISYDDNIVLDNRDFDIPDGTADEMMAAVDNLSLRDIADMLDDMGYGPIDNSTASRQATRRSASMDLDWWQTSAGMWAADLPEIPGFPCAPGRHWHVSITSMCSDDTDEFLGYGFNIGILDAHGGATLFENEFGFPYVDTQEEAMQEVESLSPEMIAQAAEDAGLEPVDNVSASRKGKHMMRKATRRTARMDLNWEFNVNLLLYEAALPAIPDYPGVNSVDVWKDDEKPGDHWCFSLCQNGYPLSIRSNEEFGIPSAGTAEEMMDAVENLDPQEIADVLAAQGYEPNED